MSWGISTWIEIFSLATGMEFGIYLLFRNYLLEWFHRHGIKSGLYISAYWYEHGARVAGFYTSGLSLTEIIGNFSHMVFGSKRKRRENRFKKEIEETVHNTLLEQLSNSTNTNSFKEFIFRNASGKIRSVIDSTLKQYIGGKNGNEEVLFEKRKGRSKKVVLSGMQKIGDRTANRKSRSERK